MKTPIEYIKEAWGIYTKKENFVFFARIMAVLVIASSLIGFAIGYFYPTDYMQNGDFSNIPMLVSFIALTIVSAVVGLWSQTTQYLSIIKMGAPEKEIFRLGYRHMWRFFAISFVIGLIILGGIILLIIPAVIFGIWYSFSTFLVLDKQMKVGVALKTSKNMVKGKFWKILGRSIVFGLFSIVASMILVAIPYAGSFLGAFIAPLLSLPFYLLYKDLLDSSV